MSIRVFRCHAFWLNWFVFFSIVTQSTAKLAVASSLVAPLGLKPGDTFRFIFVTSNTTDATSSNIRDYDNFVNANANEVTYNGAVINWLAIGSTDTVNAIDHIGTAPIAGVYSTDEKTKIATSTDVMAGGLWSGLLLSQPNLGIDKTPYNNVNVWTGTNGIGTEYATIRGGFGLGSSNTGMGFFPDPRGEVGFVPGSMDSYNWVETGGDVRSISDQYQMYGISELLTVCPEPSTLLASGLGILVIVVSSTSVKSIIYGLKSRRRMAIKVCARCIEKTKANRPARL